ncbi:MAG TPA: UDP-N-acetylmuramoyl-L-alanyl-D-glutamate--2,6-diaminopimelate ligase [Gemmatimonadales bacterium]|nr:UDP-N-acetylmuramoyl-L-alanyl-D-glutamate--2,6-diaminopimelate ligase [Gemmatimonadales bacterium]
MNLQALIDLLRPHALVTTAPPEDPIIGGLAVDSRQVTPGALFFAYPGVSSDGHDHVAQAIGRGAAAIVAERAVPSAVPLIVVRDARAAAELVAMAWYHEPMRRLRIIGVTGTNGKTTTTAMLRHVLGAGGDCGSIGTLGAYDGAGERVPSTAGQLTTPGPVDLQQTFRAMVDRGVRTICMEASSHALHQGRLDRVPFGGGIFTNLTREHLDYHPTMEHYLAAKLRLAELVAATGVLSVNADDPAWQSLRADGRTMSWGTDSTADLRITDLMTSAGSSHFSLVGSFGTVAVVLPQPGEWNVSNAAAATALALGLGMPIAEIVERLQTSPQVSGRMELLASAPVHVVRDYAHTPDAMTRLLQTLREITPARVILVFGCGGDRDRGKRPIMGEIAARGADITILTSDNPRHEDPDRIIDDIVERMPSGSYQRELDRTVAIATALGLARAGDTVVLMGKGHETYQQIGDVKEPFDEKAIVRGLLG